MMQYYITHGMYCTILVFIIFLVINIACASFFLALRHRPVFFFSCFGKVTRLDPAGTKVPGAM